MVFGHFDNNWIGCLGVDFGRIGIGKIQNVSEQAERFVNCQRRLISQKEVLRFARLATQKNPRGLRKTEYLDTPHISNLLQGFEV